MDQKPREAMDFPPLNAHRARDYADCEYCLKVRTRGRDMLDFPICESCAASLIGNARKAKK